MASLRFKAAFFDLDDTLFDHQHHRREALAAVRSAAGLEAKVDIHSLEESHERHLQRTYRQLLAGACTLEESRVERMRAMLMEHGFGADDEQLAHLERIYRAGYDRDWMRVPGSVELLDRLRAAGAWVGVVTNGRECDQVPKLERLGLLQKLDGILISEMIGHEKPSPRFFARAAREAGVQPHECVVIGDLWDTDIVGAASSGMGAVWLNRYSRQPGTGAAAVQLTSFEPLDSVFLHFLQS